MISNLEELQRLSNVLGLIQNETIDFSSEEIIFSDFKKSSLEFHQCYIIANKICFENINNPQLSIRFSECSIVADIEFTNCEFQNLEFYEVENLKSLKVSKGYEDSSKLILDRFYFYYNENTDINTDCNFSFSGCIFKNEFLIDNLNQTSGHFIIEKSKFGIDPTDKNYSNFYFGASNYNNACIIDNVFNKRASFVKSTFDYKIEDLTHKKYKNTMFSRNVFHDIGFVECDFRLKCSFYNCDFEGIAYFERILNNRNSDLTFIECQFQKYTTFIGAQITTFLLERSSFQGIVSFQDTIFKVLKIDKPHFDKIAYFDGIQITEINNCDIRTIRTIKQQLQKAENRIDYNRFRAYELSAYYKELKWNENFKDWFILGTTLLFTGFDHSWRRALIVTVSCGLSLYSCLYFIEYHGAYNPEKIEGFFVGAFRFFLITDFYSPFEERKYLDNIWSWFPFVLGKIFIAFGIYEMIQAFRKFKA